MAMLWHSALLGLMLLSWFGDAGATSVREASMAEVSVNSAVIFEGVVVDVRARKTGHGNIVTDVVFDVRDVIKGSIPQKRLKLEFLGGSVDGERQSIAGMRYPEVGEQGIYFVESIDQPLINPLYGWDQGRFRVEKDATGAERILTADQQPVIDVESADDAFFAAPSSVENISSGVARGVKAKQDGDRSEGLEKGQFKRRIRNLLGGAP